MNITLEDIHTPSANCTEPDIDLILLDLVKSSRAGTVPEYYLMLDADYLSLCYHLGTIKYKPRIKGRPRKRRQKDAK